jgi:hypothetical protein
MKQDKSAHSSTTRISGGEELFCVVPSSMRQPPEYLARNEMKFALLGTIYRADSGKGTGSRSFLKKRTKKLLLCSVHAVALMA